MSPGLEKDEPASWLVDPLGAGGRFAGGVPFGMWGLAHGGPVELWKMQATFASLRGLRVPAVVTGQALGGSCLPVGIMPQRGWGHGLPL